MRTKQLRQWVIVCGLLLVAVWLGSLIWGLGGKLQIATTQEHDAQRQYNDLESRKNTLQTDLTVLQTPYGQDAAIRSAFGVARPGEEVIVVVSPTTTPQAPSLPWWQRLFDWF